MRRGGGERGRKNVGLCVDGHIVSCFVKADHRKKQMYVRVLWALTRRSIERPFRCVARRLRAHAASPTMLGVSFFVFVFFNFLSSPPSLLSLFPQHVPRHSSHVPGLSILSVSSFRLFLSSWVLFLLFPLLHFLPSTMFSMFLLWPLSLFSYFTTVCVHVPAFRRSFKVFRPCFPVAPPPRSGPIPLPCVRRGGLSCLACMENRKKTEPSALACASPNYLCAVPKLSGPLHWRTHCTRGDRSRPPRTATANFPHPNTVTD